MGDNDSTAPIPPGEQHALESTIDMRPPEIPGYRIDGLIGSGGMARVYRGHHQVLDRLVAIKVIKETWAQDPDYRQRFLREARLVAQLDHPGVVRVHDAGETEQGVYLVMDYVGGGDLGRRIDHEGRLPVAEVRRLMRACLEALAALHGAGIIHRDVKPDNILLDSRGRPQLADLGLARPSQDTDRLTVTGAAMGTPSYMSPEQAKGSATIDGRTDLYSLGATWYALLAGRPPFDGPTPWATVAAVINEAPPDIRRQVPEVPKADADLIRQCLAKSPAGRPADAAALLRAIDRLPDPQRQGDGPHPGTTRLLQAWWLPRLAVLLVVIAVLCIWSPFSGEDGGESTPTQASAEAAPASAPSAEPDRRKTATAADSAPAAQSAAPTPEAEAAAEQPAMNKEVHGFLGGLRRAFRKPTVFQVDQPLAQACAAVESGFAGLGVTELTSQPDSHDTVYLAKLRDRDVRVRLRKGDEDGTEIEIQSGAIHDQAVGTEVRNAIEAALAP